MWKSQYFEFQEKSMECEALELKIQHFPTRFYKYRNLNEFTFESIIKSEVFLANSTILNDPCLPDLKNISATTDQSGDIYTSIVLSHIY